jgi:steroid delta-isomerase-like uncharacterized protein
MWLARWGMSEEENVALVRRWFDEVWNQGRTETVRELLDENATGLGQGAPGQTVTGPDEYLEFMRRIRESFSDLRLTVDDAFGCGERVAVRWSATMTHTGSAIGVPPTNRRVTITGIAMVVVRGGKIMGGWDAWDQAGLLQQIGAYPQQPVAFVA